MNRCIVKVITCAMSCKVVLLVCGCGGDGKSYEPRSQQFNFGDVKQGEQLTHHFTVENYGSDPIRLVRFATSCGCLSVGESIDSWNEKELLHGESLPIELSFIPGGFSEIDSASATIFYTSGSSKVQSFTLKMVAKVKSNYSLSSENIQLESVTEADIGRIFSVQIASPDDDIRILEALSVDPWFSIARTSDSSVEVELTGRELMESNRKMHFRSPIKITTNDSLKPVAVVFIEGTFNPLMTVVPQTIVVNSSEQGRVKKTARIESRGQCAARIIKGGENLADVRIVDVVKGPDNSIISLELQSIDIGVEYEDSIVLGVIRETSGVTEEVTLAVPVFRFAKGEVK